MAVVAVLVIIQEVGFRCRSTKALWAEISFGETLACDFFHVFVLLYYT